MTVKNKITLSSLLAALFLFFLPWIDFQCSGKTVITQSGMQSIYSGGTLDKQLEALGEDNDNSSDKKDENSPAPAILIAVALILLLIALYLAYKQMKNESEDSSKVILFSTGCLLCIVVQMLLGFPMENLLNEQLADKPESSSPFGESANLLTTMQISVEYRNALYLTLIALAVPFGLRFTKLGENNKALPKSSSSPVPEKLPYS